MKITGSLALLCVLAVTAAVPLDVNNTRRIVLLDKSDVVSPKSRFESLINTRIFNGKPATAGQLPYHVVLILTIRKKNSGTYESFCGGSLITDTWVLTAAHCVKSANLKQVDVVLGSLTMDGDVNSVKIPGAQWKAKHGNKPVYTVSGIDVGLVQLSRPAPIGNYIKTITLNRDRIGAGQDLVISGHGCLMKKDSTPGKFRNLMWATVKSISNPECQSYANAMLHKYRVRDTEICAIGQRNESTCSGDSGGALVLVNGNGVSQVGITSSEFGPCNRGIPTVFTRISDHYDWIQAEINTKL